MTDLVALIADLMPKALPHNVGEWTDPEEQEWFRNCGGTFSDREVAFDRWRRERAARKVLAALGIDPAGKQHDHTSTDPWSAGPNGDTAYIDGCAISENARED